MQVEDHAEDRESHFYIREINGIPQRLARMRVTKKGHDLIFTGEIDPISNRPTKYAAGDTLEGPAENLLIYEERGLVVRLHPAPSPRPERAGEEMCDGGPPSAFSLRASADRPDPRPSRAGEKDQPPPCPPLKRGVEGGSKNHDVIFRGGATQLANISSPACGGGADPGLTAGETACPPKLEERRREGGSQSPRDEEAIERLTRRSIRDAQTGCLLWQGSKAHGGYGQITYKRRMMSTHRLAYIAHHGEIPPNTYVCHACDNPSCIAIEHLFLGTPSENYRDMRKKRRVRYNAKLTLENVAEIKRRLALNEPASAIARDFAVNAEQILKIKSGLAWRDIDPPSPIPSAKAEG